MKSKRQVRRGATIVEMAFIAPVTFFLLVGIVVGGIGIFRYQEVSSLARQSARYASVHGTQYAADTGNAAATPTDIYNNVIAAENVSLDPSAVTYSVTWNSNNAPYHTTIVNGSLTPVTNTVTVTITYQWIPEALFGGVTMSSTAVTPMSH